MKSALVIAPMWNNHHVAIWLDHALPGAFAIYAFFMRRCALLDRFPGWQPMAIVAAIAFGLLRQGSANNEKLGVETTSKHRWNGGEVKFRLLKKRGDIHIEAKLLKAREPNAMCKRITQKIPPITAVENNERGAHPRTHTPPNVQEEFPRRMIECATANNPGPNHFFINYFFLHAKIGSNAWKKHMARTTKSRMILRTFACHARENNI